MGAPGIRNVFEKKEKKKNLAPISWIILTYSCPSPNGVDSNAKDLATKFDSYVVHLSMRNFEVCVPGPSARGVVETRLGRFPAQRFHGQAGLCCNFEFILYLHIPSAYMSCRFVDIVYHAKEWID